MGLPSIEFQINRGGLGRPLVGQDFVSAILFYSAALPSGFGASDRIKEVFSIEEAEDLGIVEGSADFDILHYHLDQYFQIQPKGDIFIGIYEVPVGSPTFPEVELMQRFAEGKIRNFGVYADFEALDTASVTAFNTALQTMANEDKPMSGIYTPNIQATADLSTLPNLTTLTANRVSVDIGQDGNNRGKSIFDSESKSVGSLGKLLGAVSLASVNESVAWVDKFNIAFDAEFDVAAFSNGELFKTKAPAFLDALADKGYIFLRKFTERSGTYFSDQPTAISAADDFATISNNRVIDKARRIAKAALLGPLNGPLFVDQTSGQLTEDTIQYFTVLVEERLRQMERDGEISGFDVIVNPEQNVLATSKIVITIKIVPVGVAREIEVNLGLTTSI